MAASLCYHAVMLSRRHFLTCIIGSLAAPYVIRNSGVLMPVRAVTSAPVVFTVSGYDAYARPIAETIGLASIREHLLPILTAVTGKYDELDPQWRRIFGHG